MHACLTMTVPCIQDASRNALKFLIYKKALCEQSLKDNYLNRSVFLFPAFKRLLFLFVDAFHAQIRNDPGCFRHLFYYGPKDHAVFFSSDVILYKVRRSRQTVHPDRNHRCAEVPRAVRSRH